MPFELIILKTLKFYKQQYFYISNIDISNTVRTIADVLKEEKEFSDFFDYFKSSGKLESLSKMRNITLFAVKNSGFQVFI